MALFNKHSVDEFISSKKNQLVTLNKFKNLNIHSSNDAFINAMKLTEEDIKSIKKMFSSITIGRHQMFVHTESECRSNKDIRLNDPKTYMEFNIGQNNEYNRKGTTSFTSCYKIKENSIPFNISANNVFLGRYDNCMGRLLIFHNLVDLELVNLGVDNMLGRRTFAYFMTKLILGNDYDFSWEDVNISKPDVYCDKCPKECNAGLFTTVGSLGDRIINYFLEIYNYDRYNKIKSEWGTSGQSFEDFYSHYKNVEALDGIITTDLAKDPILKNQIKGEEMRVYIPDLLFDIESALYMGNIYMNVQEYKNKILADYNNYKNLSSGIPKNFDKSVTNQILNMLLNYCTNIRSNIKLNKFLTGENHDIHSYVKGGGISVPLTYLYIVVLFLILMLFIYYFTKLRSFSNETYYENVS